MKKIFFSDEDCIKIVDMYKCGMSAAAIGNIYGCSRNPISKVLKKYGIQLDTVLRKISKNEYAKIIELYNVGKTKAEIAQQYNCSTTVIGNIMKQLKVSTRPNGFTKSDAESMYKLYLDGKRIHEIATIYNTDRHTVHRVLLRNGFETDRRTYSFNEHYFDVVETSEQAYILGLLWADGHNNVKRHTVTLQLQEKDRDILEQINCLMSSNRPLYFCPLSEKNINWSNTYTLTLNSKHLSRVLESYGMTQRKSLTLEFPTGINESLYGAFIRGYFDGDGSVCFNSITTKTEVSMVGTLMFLQRIQKICNDLNIKTSIYSKNKGNSVIKTLHITNRVDRIKFLNWIYQDASIKLERKYQKYQQILNDNNVSNSLTT